MSGKYALLIGNAEYTDPGLAKLTAPGRDTKDLARALEDREIGAFDEVGILINESEHVVREAIDDFFNDKKTDDLLVLYFSGHGVRDELGALYLAVRNTSLKKLRATGVKSDYIREAMDQSRSKRQVLILDCCNSGAFAPGTKAATGVSIGTSTAFEGGYGRIILTASDATQYAWEGDKVIGETDNSLFTHFLVEGLKGEADLDSDGRITVDELYNYAYEKVKLATPKQTPSKFSSREQGEIVLRANINPESVKPAPLPDDLIAEIEDQRPYVREAAVKRLSTLLKNRNLGLARSARLALEKMAEGDDSRSVAGAASQALESVRQAEKLIEEARLAKAEAEREAEEKKLAEEAERKRNSLRKAEEERAAQVKLETGRILPEETPRPPSKKGKSISPTLAFTLSLIFGGVGQIFLGQVKKGIVLTVVILATLFIGVGVVLNLASAVDAHAIAKKIRAGQSVGEWEFGFSWEGTLIALALSLAGLIAFGLFMLAAQYLHISY